MKVLLHGHGYGKGDGSVVQKAGYPQPPAYDGALKDLPEGKIFHSLTYGKNLGMGSHAGQLDQHKRWLVTEYVKYLQLGGKMPGGTATDSTATALTAQ